MFQPHLADHILFVLFGIVFPANAIFRSQPLLRTLGEWDTSMKLGFYRSNGLLLWLMAAAVVVLWVLSGRPLAELGFRWPLPGVWNTSLLLSVAFLLAYSVDAWIEVATPRARARTREHWRANTPFLPETRRELRAFNWLALSAAVGEEVLFRGYFLLYLISLLGDSPGRQALALGGSTLIFALSHYYQGWRAIVKIGILSLAFGLIFLVSGSLLLPVGLHFVVDLVGGWLGYRVLRGEG